MKTAYAAMTHMVRCALFIILCILFVSSSTTLAEEKETDQEALDAIDEEIRWLQSETYVITPSKIPEKIKKSAASITVVTDKQIRQMGAKDLTDVIERIVPSFLNTNFIGDIFLTSRGQVQPRYLIMINNLPVYDADDQGYHYRNFYDFNIDNVKRIEFIRGPGSALYGANAYHGVINIITKRAEDTDGVELIARGGSWHTQQYNLLFGKKFSDLEVDFNFNYFKTRGNSAFIKADFLTWVDQNIYAPYGISPVSMTPGYTNEYKEKYELSLNLKYKGFIFDGGYIDRQFNRPLMPGGINLTEKATRLLETYYLNLGYEATLGDKLDLSARVYRLYRGYINDSQILPPGWVDVWNSGSFGTIWPEGSYYIGKCKTSRTGMEMQTTYKMSDSNTIVAGATYEKQKYFDDEEWADWEYLPDSDALIQLPTMQKVPGSTPDQKNDFKALFLEDVWDITEDLRLTMGAHYADYSSFGSHFSPRAGLTWEYMKGYDLKLLYGHAFSVPSDTETSYRIEGTTLEPQTVDSYEISLGAEFTPSFEGRITLFRYNDKNLITWVYDPHYGCINSGGSVSKGFEVEARYDFGRGTYVAGNYSYTSLKSGDIPRIYVGKIMANIRLSRYLNLYVDCNRIGGWNAENDFFLESSTDRTIVNTTLIARNFIKGYEGLEIRGSVYNLLDKKWAEFVHPFDVPSGWPQPGINFLVELKYKF